MRSVLSPVRWAMSRCRTGHESVRRRAHGRSTHVQVRPLDVQRRCADRGCRDGRPPSGHVCRREAQQVDRGRAGDQGVLAAAVAQDASGRLVELAPVDLRDQPSLRAASRQPRSPRPSSRAARRRGSRPAGRPAGRPRRRTRSRANVSSGDSARASTRPTIRAPCLAPRRPTRPPADSLERRAATSTPRCRTSSRTATACRAGARAAPGPGRRRARHGPWSVPQVHYDAGEVSDSDPVARPSSRTVRAARPPARCPAADPPLRAARARTRRRRSRAGP